MTVAGTLVSQKHVVTAAHCVNETFPVRVRLGDSDIRTEFDCLHVEEGCDSGGWAQTRPASKNIFILQPRLL